LGKCPSLSHAEYPVKTGPLSKRPHCRKSKQPISTAIFFELYIPHGISDLHIRAYLVPTLNCSALQSLIRAAKFVWVYSERCCNLLQCLQCDVVFCVGILSPFLVSLILNIFACLPNSGEYQECNINTLLHACTVAHCN